MSGTIKLTINIEHRGHYVWEMRDTTTGLVRLARGGFDSYTAALDDAERYKRNPQEYVHGEKATS